MTREMKNRVLAWIWAEGWTELDRGERMAELLDGIPPMSSYTDEEIDEFLESSKELMPEVVEEAIKTLGYDS